MLFEQGRGGRDDEGTLCLQIRQRRAELRQRQSNVYGSSVVAAHESVALAAVATTTATANSSSNNNTSVVVVVRTPSRPQQQQQLSRVRSERKSKEATRRDGSPIVSLHGSRKRM